MPIFIISIVLLLPRVEAGQLGIHYVAACCAIQKQECSASLGQCENTASHLSNLKPAHNTTPIPHTLLHVSRQRKTTHSSCHELDEVPHRS